MENYKASSSNDQKNIMQTSQLISYHFDESKSDETLKSLNLILDTFSHFNELPFNEETSFYIRISTLIEEANEKIFLFLFNNNFFDLLRHFLMENSKPIVFQHCIDIVNKIFENSSAESFLNPFFEPTFVQFVFYSATYINISSEKPPIPIINYNQVTIYVNLLKLLMNILKKKSDIISTFRPIHFFERICRFYLRDNNYRASVSALDILVFSLSQENIVYESVDLNPIDALVNDYLFKVNEQMKVISQESDGLYRASTIRFDDFSNICQLIVLLAKRNQENFFTTINTDILFPVFIYTNQLCAQACLNLFEYILSLPNVPKGFIESIDIDYIHNMINSFGALASEDDRFIIALCHFLDAFLQLSFDDTEKIIYLLNWILNDGSFRMQQEAMKSLCRIYLLPNFAHYLDRYMMDSFLPKLISLFNSADDVLLGLILRSFIKIFEGSQASRSRELVDIIIENDITDFVIEDIKLEEIQTLSQLFFLLFRSFISSEND
ncbi:hypothetical protein TRFO_17874 [Tritrichomonas foetus]|uniref:Uncharacterized protein n=1 Tax=Tritrichomonas foetus TaxID=1144522 RepID=A0A1J4KSD5_9EUKA|nr:hypothetical protein TRFO_17874 [Tritrichomonas foetus]|eukprot:OHT12381.1 hypothetical protein TRFO_17874 [Tritrichomonas foetus]